MRHSRGGPERRLTIIEHLEELRLRLIVSLVALALGTVVAYTFHEQLLLWLRRPAPQLQLIALSITEAFANALQLALFGGLVLALPVILGQVWGFVAPGLLPSERRLALPFLLGTVLAFVGGIAFGYWAVLPVAVPFLIGFGEGVVAVLPSLSRYVQDVTQILLIFGVVFEMPVLAYFLGRLGVISAAFMAKQRKYAIFILIVLGAVLSPTVDMVSLAILSGPLVLLYELSIVLVRLAEPKPGLEPAEENL